MARGVFLCLEMSVLSSVIEGGLLATCLLFERFIVSEVVLKCGFSFELDEVKKCA